MTASSALKTTIVLGLAAAGGYILYRVYKQRQIEAPFGEEWMPWAYEPGYEDQWILPGETQTPTNPGVHIDAGFDQQASQAGGPIDLWAYYPAGTPLTVTPTDCGLRGESCMEQKYVLSQGDKPVSMLQLSAFPNDAIVGNWLSCASIAPNTPDWTLPSGVNSVYVPGAGYKNTIRDSFGNQYPVVYDDDPKSDNYDPYHQNGQIVVNAGFVIPEYSEDPMTLADMRAPGTFEARTTSSDTAGQSGPYPPASAGYTYPTSYAQTKTGYLTVVDTPPAQTYAVGTRAQTPLSQLQLADQPAQSYGGNQNWFQSALSQAQSTGVIGGTVPISAVSQAQAHPSASAASLTPATAARASPATMAVAASGEAGRAGRGAEVIASAYSSPTASSRTSGYGGWTGWAI